MYYGSREEVFTMPTSCPFRDIRPTRFLGVSMACAWLLTTSVVFGQIGNMGGVNASGGMGGRRAGGGDRRSSPSDYYRGATPPPSQTVLAPHGGMYMNTESNVYETVFMPLQIRIYVYDKSLKTISARDTHVQASIQLPGESTVSQLPFQYIVLPPTAAEQDYVVAVFDVSQLRGKETPIAFEFSNLPDREHPTARFTPLLSNSKVRPYVARVLATKAETDSVLRQRVCPVCGDVLGSKMPVVKLLIAEYPLYVCSEDCMMAVRERPAKYLPQPQAPVGGH
jgi:hypothetical protein